MAQIQKIKNPGSDAGTFVQEGKINFASQM
jgi:hypothetical protein